jgi:hypothetical protein
MFDINFVPQNMTIQDLRGGIAWLAEKLYTDECLMQRRRPFFDELWRQRGATLTLVLGSAV